MSGIAFANTQRAVALCAVLLAGSVQGSEENSSKSDSEDRLQNAGLSLFAIGPNMGLVGFDSAETLNGARITPTTELMHGARTVSRPRDAAIDRHGALYLISGANGGSVAVYENPLTANGSRKPDRMVFGRNTQISKSPTGIAIDRENERLYLSNAVTGILVFDISSSQAFSGDVTPLRVFRVDQPCAVRSRSGLQPELATLSTLAEIHRTSRCSTHRAIPGDATPNRTINHMDFDNRIGIDVDSAGRLLVAARTSGQG
ncbi:MAG: hypothetical protein R3C19_24195 [Planctomycetaceae bacterium]